MRRHIAAWCIAALGLGALAACSNANGSKTATDAGSSPGSGPVASASPQPPSVAASPTTAPPTTPAPTKPPPTVKPKPSRTITATPIKPGPTGTLTLTGTIYAGAEPSCLLLTQGRSTYLLNAASSWKLRAGQRVIVNGVIAPRGIMSHCMQGIMFVVKSADILSPAG